MTIAESKIVAVEPTEKCFSINWMLTKRCNYDCMYCKPIWHDNSSKPHSLSTLQRAWENFWSKSNLENSSDLGMGIKLSFTGGEVTVVRAFLPFIRWLNREYREIIYRILVTSNGSASINYYQRLLDEVDALTFSFHSEFTDEAEFFNKALILSRQARPPKFFHINIMKEHWNQERITLYEKFCQDNSISHSVNIINYSYQTRDYPLKQGKQNLGI